MARPRALIGFSSVAQVNEYIAPWYVVPVIDYHGSDQVVTLNLMQGDTFIVNSHCVTYLVKHVIEQQGVIWATSRELYQKPVDE